MARKAYRSERISVSFDPQRCIHARECVRGLPEVFDREKRPWIGYSPTGPNRTPSRRSCCAAPAAPYYLSAKTAFERPRRRRT